MQSWMVAASFFGGESWDLSVEHRLAIVGRNRDGKGSDDNMLRIRGRVNVGHDDFRRPCAASAKFLGVEYRRRCHHMSMRQLGGIR